MGTNQGYSQFRRCIIKHILGRIDICETKKKYQDIKVVLLKVVSQVRSG